MLRPLFSADFTTSADRLVSGSVLVISERNVEEVKDFCRGFAGRRSPTTFHLSQSLGARFLSQDPPGTLSRSDRGLGGTSPLHQPLRPRRDPVLHVGLVQQCAGVIDHVYMHLLKPERDRHEAGCSLIKAAPLGRTWRLNFRARTSIEIFD